MRLARRRIAARVTRRARALRAAMTEAGGLYVPERLHSVRVASKKLRYALEIAAELGARDAARLAARVRRVQITLGQLQDRTIVLREVQQIAGSADPGAALDGLHVLISRLEQSCRRLHAEYLAGRDGMTEVFARVRQDVVPELTRSQRPAPLKAVLPVSTNRAAGGARR
jgi:CHAD domain-containing protein